MSDRRLQWYRRPILWIWLAVFYALSPKMGTMAALAEVKPREFRAQAKDVLRAHFLPSGDVAVCFLLDRLDRGELEEYEVELPIAHMTSLANPDVRRRTSEVQKRNQTLRFWIDDTRMKQGCIRGKGDTDIFTGKNRAWGRGVPNGVPQELAFRAEIYIGDYPAYFYYVNREPLRKTRFAKAAYAPEEVKDEYDIEFIFQTQETSIRWWNVFFLPPAILIDAVTGPLGWIAVINQHGPRL